MSGSGAGGGDQAPDPTTGSTAWLAGVIEQSAEVVIVIDDAGLIVYANEAASLIGWRPADLVGRSGFDFLHPDDVSRAVSTLAAVERQQRPLPGLIRIRQPDGGYTQLDVTPGLFSDPEGRSFSVYTMRPSNLNQSHWLALASIVSGDPPSRSLDLFATGLSSAIDGPMGITFEEQGQIQVAGTLPELLAGGGDVVRPAAHPFTRALAGEVVVVPDPDAFGPEIAELARARSLGPCVVVPVPDPGATRRALMVQWPPDQTMADLLAISLPRRPRQIVALALQRRADQQRLEHLALHDPLTGLPNRTQFFAVLERGMRGRDPAALCYVDLDGFKAVNDERGHVAGDGVLVRCAERIAASARAGDVVARLGGDEFAVYCPGVHEPEVAGEIAQRVIDAMARDDIFGVGASVGVALLAPGTSTDDAVQAADGALYDAKRAGRGTWRLAARDT
jgi:diguanylate cyclase (GGDEF)-like protein/PAS domain S-box-containing protein